MKTHKSPDMSLIGERIGKLTVDSYFGFHKSRNRFSCTCDCGNKTIVPEISLSLKNTRSCGCLQKERVRQVRTTHGHTKNRKVSREYEAFMAMMARCYNPKNSSYKNYGEKGIKVCEEWLNDGGFEKFLEHVGPKPSGDWSIGRIDNSRGYEPVNVRWETRTQQNQNRSITRNITYNGITKCLTEWSRVLGVRHSVLRTRISRIGLDSAFEMCLSEVAKGMRPKATVDSLFN